MGNRRRMSGHSAAAAAAGVDEQQRIAFDSTADPIAPIAGAFTLLIDATETEEIAYNANAAAIKAAIEAATYVSGAGGTVTVASNAANTWDVTFGGGLAGTDVPTMTVGESVLFIAAGNPSVSVSNPGVDNVDEPTGVSGNFTDGDESNPATYIITFSGTTPNDGYWNLTTSEGGGSGGDVLFSDEPTSLLTDWVGSGAATSGTVTLTRNANGSGITSPSCSGTPVSGGFAVLRYFVEGQHQEIVLSLPVGTTSGQFSLLANDVTIDTIAFDATGAAVQAILDTEFGAESFLVSGTAMNDGGLSLYRNATGVGPIFTVANGTGENALGKDSQVQISVLQEGG